MRNGKIGWMQWFKTPCSHRERKVCVRGKKRIMMKVVFSDQVN